MEDRSFSKIQRMYDEYRARYLRAREDMISKLPDPLLCQILSYLPTKDVVRTSVLSHRWKSVCLLVPTLDLSSSEFLDYDTFVSFIEKLLDFSREENSVLYKVKLSLQKDENDECCVTRWIDFVANPKLKHLDVECMLVNRKLLETIPQSLYRECDTLVYLRLHRVSLGELNSLVSLPCLKTMRLEHNVYASDASLESLISSPPVLQDLSIVRMVPDNVKVLRVRSHSLTSFHVDYLYGEGDGFVDVFEREGSGVFVDAPRLKYLKFEDDLSESKIITNAVSLEKVNVAFVFDEKDFADVVDLPKRNMVNNFFNSISGVKEMKISLYTMELLDYNREYKTYDPLPQFCNVNTLKVTFSVLNLDMMMPTLLESFPNLKSLVLKLDDDAARKRAAHVRLSSAPSCLMSSLEFVKIKCFNGGPVNMEVARYFLENSQILKKLVLDFKCSEFEQGFYMLRSLLALPRRSSSCQVLLC